MNFCRRTYEYISTKRSGLGQYYSNKRRNKSNSNHPSSLSTILLSYSLMMMQSHLFTCALIISMANLFFVYIYFGGDQVSIDETHSAVVRSLRRLQGDATPPAQTVIAEVVEAASNNKICIPDGASIDPNLRVKLNPPDPVPACFCVTCGLCEF